MKWMKFSVIYKIINSEELKSPRLEMEKKFRNI